MTAESKLHRDAERAEQAKRLMENPLIKEAFEALERDFTQALFLTNVSDVMGREKLFLAVNVVRKVHDFLATVISNGSVAASQLQELSRMAMPKKNWEDI